MTDLEKDVTHALVAMNAMRIVCVCAAAIVGLVVFMAFRSAHGTVDAALERQIGSATHEAQILRSRARAIAPAAETVYVAAKAKQDRYQDLRRDLHVDAAAMTIGGPTFTPVQLPSPIIQLVLACDTAVAALRTAVDTTRAGWVIERAAADTQLVADSLKDLRQPTRSRCGFKCGVAVGTAATVAAIVAAVKIVHAVADRRAPTASLPR